MTCNSLPVSVPGSDGKVKQRNQVGVKEMKALRVWFELAPGIIALVLVFASGLSLAHSSKEATEPADGAVIDASPPVIAMRFDEPMRITKITLTDSNGKGFDLARNDDLKPLKRFEAVPETLSPGRYTVEWRGLASDGHAMSGSFSFRIGD